MGPCEKFMLVALFIAMMVGVGMALVPCQENCDPEDPEVCTFLTTDWEGWFNCNADYAEGGQFHQYCDVADIDVYTTMLGYDECPADTNCIAPVKPKHECIECGFCLEPAPEDNRFNQDPTDDDN